MSGQTIKEIRIDEIDCSGRLRPVNVKAAAKLALSMQDVVGDQVIKQQIEPIVVRPKQGGGYLLVVGAHRVAAAQMLGWTEIAAIVTDMSADDAKMMEVDENLYRADITAADRTLFVKEKLQLYTIAGGKLRRGRSLSKRPTVGLLDGDQNTSSEEVVAFYKDLERKFGIKRSTGKKLVRRGRNISPAMWAVIQGAKKAVPDGLLDKMADLPPNDRKELERLVLVEGRDPIHAVKSLADKPKKKPQTPENVARGLAMTWAGWSAAERSKFIRLLKTGAVK